MKMPRVLYDTFNARYLSLEEVAESFVPNEQFEELIKNNHSLLMGPRGSGKTTLLKMLTPLALSSWKGGSKARQVREKIPFIGVYIPTDIHWKRQLQHFENKLGYLPNYVKVDENMYQYPEVYRPS